MKNAEMLSAGTIKIFIISWKGQHQNAELMASQLDKFRENLCVVFSDPDDSVAPNVRCRTIRRPNDLFFADKFKACLDASDSELMMLLHADCTCDDWANVVERCIDAHRNNPAIGVWAPYIKGSAYPLKWTRIGRISGSRLSLVVQTDGICFSISRPIIDRLRMADYGSSLYGWGIDWLMVCSAFSKNLYVAVDEGVTVNHSPTTGYDEKRALAEMQQFLLQFSVFEMINYRLLVAYGASQRSISKNNR